MRTVSHCAGRRWRERNAERERNRGISLEYEAGIFSNYSAFLCYPRGQDLERERGKEKSHSFISIRGLFCFSSQACGPYKQWQNTRMHTHTCAHTNIHTHTEKLMPSSHCMILARFFNRRQVMINRQQMHNIGGKSVLVHVRDNHAV